MARNGADARLQGEEQLMRNLRAIPIGLQRKHNKKALRRAGGLITKAARKNVKKPTKSQLKKGAKPRTGGLGKSLAVKVIGKSGQPTAGAIIGHRKDRVFEGYAGKHVPANIAHLVELGHAGPKPAPPHPYLRPAYESTKSAQKTAIATTLWAGIKESGREVH